GGLHPSPPAARPGRGAAPGAGAPRGRPPPGGGAARRRAPVRGGDRPRLHARRARLPGEEAGGSAAPDARPPGGGGARWLGWCDNGRGRYHPYPHRSRYLGRRPGLNGPFVVLATRALRGYPAHAFSKECVMGLKMSEILLIMGVLLLLFGGSRLPQLGSS